MSSSYNSKTLGVSTNHSQRPLKKMDGIALNGPDIRKDGLKLCKWLKFMSKSFEKYFQMDN